jgi:addiction module RelE/StbE family toxin
MNLQFDPGFIKKLKAQNVLIRKNFRERITVFFKEPNHPKLNNHPLKGEWQEYRSIDITSDWRAIYQELQEGENKVAYFVALGTHDDLYV